MKRAHRRWQRVLWLLLAPAAAVVIALALSLRAAVPANPALPPAVSAATATPGR